MKKLLIAILALTIAYADGPNVESSYCQRGAINFTTLVDELNNAQYSAKAVNGYGLSTDAKLSLYHDRYTYANQIANQIKIKVLDLYDFGCITKTQKATFNKQMNTVIKSNKKQLNYINNPLDAFESLFGKNKGLR
jgi:hypothetical protein